jgi:hypothetical protein
MFFEQTVDPVEVRNLCETDRFRDVVRTGASSDKKLFDRCIAGITHVQIIFLSSFPDSNFV